jgi:YVTN family beta-propeller protein
MIAAIRLRPLTSLLLAIAVLAVSIAGGLAAEQIFAGPQGHGTSITPNGWYVTPAGQQVDLADETWWGDRPFGQALSPDGGTLLVSSNGQSTQSLKVFDTASRTVQQTIAYKAPEALYVGLAWSPDGSHAYASAGGNNKGRVYDFAGGRLTERQPIPVPQFPVGLTISSDGRTMYAAENLGGALAVIDIASTKVTSVPVGPCETAQPAPGTGSPPPQCQPYGVALSSDGRTAYVSNWGEHSVTLVDTAVKQAGSAVEVGTHPNALIANPAPGRHELYVANGESDTVSVIDTATKAVVRTMDLAPYPGAPQGSSPHVLGIAPGGDTLYVANAGNNDIAVVALDRPTEDRGGAAAAAAKQGAARTPEGSVIRGMIPTAWYPSGISVSPDGATVFVENAKGLGAGPNPGNPGPFNPNTPL